MGSHHRGIVGDQERHRRRQQPPVGCCEREVSESCLTSERHDRSRVIFGKRPDAVHAADGNRGRPSLWSEFVILSDRTVREQLAAGRIVIDPFDESLIQPSSIDVRMSNLFRVFRNHTAGVIDVKRDMTSLTELVEMPADGSEPFMLHPGEFALGSTLERIALPDDLVARIEGKALAIGTPIPTPDGWTAMADLRIGDRVFTDTGCPTRVKDMSEVMLGRPCYEVEFSDGSLLIADADHQWVTRTKEDRRNGRDASIRTTREIAGKVKYSGQEYNHHVHLAGAVQYAEQKLAIDPYVLGLWLGDGTSTKAEITTCDPELLEEIERRGYVVGKANNPHTYRIGLVGHTRSTETGRYTRNDSLSSALRNEGLLGNKHVPARYLRSSVRQRWELLMGLMDSDGYCDKWGRCEFTTVKQHLADQVFELVASLGFRPVIGKKPAMLNGVDHGPKYDVTFTPERPVFNLTRKAMRQRSSGRFKRHRSIVAVRRVSSVPVKCIEVDAAHGVYLAGRSFIPTHNSSLGRLGLLIHSTAGFIDAGFDGHVTLELANVASLPITLYPGMKIGQVSFVQMTTPADQPYGKGARGSKYQGQRGPTPSRYFENFG
jgi:deoxycytidine triphosphate deaminase